MSISALENIQEKIVQQQYVMTIHADEEMVRNAPNPPFPYQEITIISGGKLKIYLSRDDLFESFLSQYNIPYLIE
jgi:hypothetical protein